MAFLQECNKSNIFMTLHVSSNKQRANLKHTVTEHHNSSSVHFKTFFLFLFYIKSKSHSVRKGQSEIMKYVVTEHHNSSSVHFKTFFNFFFILYQKYIFSFCERKKIRTYRYELTIVITQLDIIRRVGKQVAYST